MNTTLGMVIVGASACVILLGMVAARWRRTGCRGGATGMGAVPFTGSACAKTQRTRDNSTFDGGGYWSTIFWHGSGDHSDGGGSDGGDCGGGDGGGGGGD